MGVGLSLNNPGDLEFNERDKWQGLDDPSRDGRWFRFKTAPYGIRAIAVTLVTYQDKYGLNTIEEWIKRFSPPSENETEAYIKAVCDETGLVRDARIDAHEYRFQRAIVPAIIYHEQGSQPYSAAQIDEGLRLAGIISPVAASTTIAAVKDPKVIGASILGTAGAIQAAVAPFASVWDTINGLGIDPRIIVWGSSIAIGIVAAWFVIEWIKRRQQGLA